ncbi:MULTISPECIES: hypothetical protein [unclassified Chryseobacterium]|uniref:immunity protein Imm33 domain-containing protein n=1 Tax=unclassified Chryseobacterium TaxID=2593645 RepID=UPI000D343111|nr:MULTISPECIES: hypothetical protein [unclassified Chryseobacterium]PTT70311.1 hypothetical protein DBR25_18455 [Chryseobacterium sp. HMWF001]PVV61840.1 hypothetical protein DD829_01170 [Chryseobacterium sp. HMWF035]
MGLFSRKKAFKIRDVEFYSDREYHYSKGLKPYLHKEIKIVKQDLSLENLGHILQYLVEFIQDEKPDIKSGDKVTCFTWNIMFQEVSSGFFEIFELIPEKLGFEPGLIRTLFVLNQQLLVCDQLKAEPDFPDINQIVLADPLTKTGLPIHLFRWKREYPDSGWMVITDDFDEEANEFEEMALGQFMMSRPEIVKFMALPAGFKIIWKDNDANIAFDNYLVEN